MIRLLCFESERNSENCNFVAKKLDFEYIALNKSNSFPMLSPFTAAVRGEVNRLE